MVNYHDPHTIAREFSVLNNLQHVFAGLFFWEFFTTLDYEWDVIRGRRPYRPTIWVYSLARVATFLTIITDIIGVDNTTRMNCQAWASFAITFPNAAFAFASLLILFRIMAIWNKKIVILIAMGVWVTDLAFLINGEYPLLIKQVFHTNPVISQVVYGSAITNILGSLIADVVLLFIMLIGLLRMLMGTGGGFGFACVLWKQGLIWLLVALVAEVPSTVFIFLDLNEPMSYMFQVTNTITMTIAATRMYHSLMNLGSSEISRDSLRGSGRKGSTMRVRSETIPLSQMESMRTDQYLKSQMGGSSWDISTNPHGCYETHELSLNVDVDSASGPGKLGETAASRMLDPAPSYGVGATDSRAGPAVRNKYDSSI